MLDNLAQSMDLILPETDAEVSFKDDALISS